MLMTTTMISAVTKNGSVNIEATVTIYVHCSYIKILMNIFFFKSFSYFFIVYSLLILLF